MFYSKSGANVKGWQLGKVIDILQALICLVKLLVDWIPFPNLGHAYNLDSIINIVSCRQG